MNVPRVVPANVPVADGPAPAPTGVAADVTADVTADAPAPTHRGRAGKSRQRNDGNSHHLTRTENGWRFQMRVPAALADDFRLAGLGLIIRKNLGPLGRGDAKRLARKCAALRDAVFALATTKKAFNVMDTLTPPEKDLAQQVIAACQTAIGRVLKQPKQAIGLAHGLNGALTSLLLVQAEAAKGDAGAGLPGRAVARRAGRRPARPSRLGAGRSAAGFRGAYVLDRQRGRFRIAADAADHPRSRGHAEVGLSAALSGPALRRRHQFRAAAPARHRCAHGSRRT